LRGVKTAAIETCHMFFDVPIGADALYFGGGNTFEYAKSVSRPGLVDDEDTTSGVRIVV
jgi:peptidase E